MKEIKKVDDIYLEEYGISVHRYLTYAQIQSIADAMLKEDTWSKRAVIYDLLLLTYATSLTPEEIKEMNHDDIVASGLMDAVVDCIENVYRINDCINFATSLSQIIHAFIQNVPQLTQKMQEIADKYAKGK